MIEYYSKFVEEVKDLSDWTRHELILNGSNSLRTHRIKWNYTSEPNGFRFPYQGSIAEDPYQFSISANEHGRIHGFFRDNTFYIVWLDRDHELYS